MSRNRKHRKLKPIRFRGPGDAKRYLRRSAWAGHGRPDRNDWPAIVGRARERAGRNHDTLRVINHAVRLAGLFPAEASAIPQESF